MTGYIPDYADQDQISAGSHLDDFGNGEKSRVA
jgi:hypothetical protein